MPATAAWLASAEAMLNRCIDESAHARELARRLQGTSLQIDVHGITSVRASVFGGRLALLPSGDDGADATISGSLPALLLLAKGVSGREGGAAQAGAAQAGAAPAGAPAAAGRPAQIRGDAEIANLYRELFAVARPDPEEELSRWIGDLPARRISEWARRALHLARHVHRTAGENIAEYLQEEGRDLVNRTELEEFLRGVDELRETADRIEVRLGHLERRLQGAA